MIFRETLPPGCPPREALHLEGTKVFYRLVRTIPPSDCDFHSRWREKPEQRGNWRRQGEECKVKGLSIFKRAKSAQYATKYPDLQDRVVCRVEVTPRSGPVTQGGSSHRTWWPYKDFDILSQYHEDLL